MQDGLHEVSTNSNLVASVGGFSILLAKADHLFAKANFAGFSQGSIGQGRFEGGQSCEEATFHRT